MKIFSSDDGLTWTNPVVAFDTPGVDDRNHGGGITEAGTILIALTKYQQGAFGWIRSTDNGATFSAFKSFGACVGNSRPPLIVIPGVRVGMTGDCGGNIKIAWSEDDGVTVNQVQTINTPVFSNEPVAMYVGGGRVILLWGCGPCGGTIYQQTSTDSGVTWSSATATSITTSTSAHGMAMARTGNNLFVLYRFGSAPSDPYYAVGDIDVVFDNPSGWESGAITTNKPGDGYGAVTKLPDNRLLLTYAFEDPDRPSAGDHDLEYTYADLGSAPPPPPPPPTVPDPPQKLQASPGDSEISLTWETPLSDGGSPITGYTVHRGLSSGQLTPIASLGAVLSYRDTGLTNGATYFYHVTAINSAGESSPSNEVSATPAAPPPPPPPLGWNNTAPTIGNPIDRDEGTHNVPYSRQFDASDPDTNQTLLWTLDTDATFLTIDGQDRTAWLNGTPAFADRDRSFYVNITVADQGCGGACSRTAFVSFTLYINNTGPTITNKISTDTGIVGQAYSTDFDHLDVNGDSVTWTLDTNASFLNIDLDGTVSGTPDIAGSYYVDVTVGDGSINDSVNYTLTIESGSVGGDPVLTIDVVSSYEIMADGTVKFNSEVKPPGQYTYLWEFGDGQASNARNPTHHYEYSLSAKFDVRLTVCSEEQCAEVNLQVTLLRWTYLAVIVGIVLFVAAFTLVAVFDAQKRGVLHRGSAPGGARYRRALQSRRRWGP